MRYWFKSKFGAVRASTVALLVVFSVLFWVQQNFQPEPRPELPEPAVVPPGFVPDPNYTWVPRTDVRSGTSGSATTTTTSPSETTSPGETTTPTSSEESTSTAPNSEESRPQTTPTGSAPDTTSARPEAPATVPPR